VVFGADATRYRPETCLNLANSTAAQRPRVDGASVRSHLRLADGREHPSGGLHSGIAAGAIRHSVFGGTWALQLPVATVWTNAGFSGMGTLESGPNKDHQVSRVIPEGFELSLIF